MSPICILPAQHPVSSMTDCQCLQMSCIHGQLARNLFECEMKICSALWQGLSVEAIAALRSIQADSVQGASAGSASALCISFLQLLTHMVDPLAYGWHLKEHRAR